MGTFPFAFVSLITVLTIWSIRLIRAKDWISLVLPGLVLILVLMMAEGWMSECKNNFYAWDVWQESCLPLYGSAGASPIWLARSVRFMDAVIVQFFVFTSPVWVPIGILKFEEMMGKE